MRRDSEGVFHRRFGTNSVSVDVKVNVFVCGTPRGTVERSRHSSPCATFFTIGRMLGVREGPDGPVSNVLVNSVLAGHYRRVSKVDRGLTKPIIFDSSKRPLRST